MADNHEKHTLDIGRMIQTLSGHKDFCFGDKDSRVSVDDIISALQMVEPHAEEPEPVDLPDETKEWLKNMAPYEALWNIADILLDWDGYRTRDGLGGLINEVWAYARFGAKQYGPVKPIWEVDNPHRIGHFLCGSCKANIGTSGARYCWYCGRPVKYDG